MKYQMTYEYLENIVGMMPGNVYWKNRDGMYLACNMNAAQLVKLESPKQIVGKKLHDFIPKSVANVVERTDNDIMEHGKLNVLTENAFDHEGNPAVYLTHKIPLKNNRGIVTGLAGISVDITQLEEDKEAVFRQAQEEARACRTDFEFLHIIKNTFLKYIRLNSSANRLIDKVNKNLSVLDELRDNKFSVKLRPLSILTSQENNSLQLLVLGYTVKEIARILAISHRTVESYIENIKNKTGLRKKWELVAIFIERL